MRYFYSIRREEVLSAADYRIILTPAIDETIEDFFKRGLIIIPIEITREDSHGCLDISYCVEFTEEIDKHYLLVKERLEIGL